MILRHNVPMSQLQSKPREFVTKEIFIALTPILASYVWTIFYEAGFSRYYGIPYELISLDMTDVFLTNRLSLMAAVIGFLWIGLYYNLMPSFRSMTFKAIITLFLGLAISVGAYFGNYSARTMTEFYTLNSNPEQVVLRIYGDNIISAPFDLTSHTIKREFYIHKVGGNEALSLSVKQLGELSPVH